MPKIKKAHAMERVIHSISRGMGIIAIFVLVMMMIFTVLDVVLRKFFNSPIPGGLELVEFMMIFTGFLGLAWCGMKESHIRVDLLVSIMRRRVQGIIDSFCYLLGFCICAIIAWRSVMESLGIRQLHTESAVLKIPIFPFYLVLASGYAVLSLAILVLLVKSLREAIKG